MKINLLILFLFTTLLLNAQIKKGALFIGGDVSVNSSKFTGTNQSTSQNQAYNFYPSLGWAAKDNIIAGGRLLVSFYDSRQNVFYSSKGHNLGAGIWMRKYLPLGKSFYLFGDAGISGQSIYRKQTTMQQPDYFKEKGFSISAGLFPGVSYQIKNRWYLEAAFSNLISLGYERKNTEQATQGGSVSKGVNNSFNISGSLGNGVPLQVGMRWIINKKYQ
ncbi:MAG: hypothetical protein H7Z13_13095 [Ferruginibacter sp.]|nr:hypothetical protein [Ferruginibacter sp.]